MASEQAPRPQSLPSKSVRREARRSATSLAMLAYRAIRRCRVLAVGGGDGGLVRVDSKSVCQQAVHISGEEAPAEGEIAETVSYQPLTSCAVRLEGTDDA